MSASMGFREENRVAVQLEQLPFVHIWDLLRTGRGYLEDMAQARSAGRSGQAQPPTKKRKAKGRLRDTDPW